MRVTRVMIFLEYLGIFQLTLSMNKLELLSEEQRHIVLCINSIIHQHLLPRQSLLVSLPSVGHDVTSPTSNHTHLHDVSFSTVATFLRNISQGERWSVEVSRLEGPEPEIQNEDFLKHDSYIIFIGIQKQESDIIWSVRNQLYNLKNRGSWNYRARFVVVTSVHVTMSIQELSFKILEEMWEGYSVMNVLLVISESSFTFNDGLTGSAATEDSPSGTEVQLFSWFPYTSHTHCDKIHEAVLVDRCNSNGEFAFKANLFPEKIPTSFHGCRTRVISFIYPPAVMKNSDNNYTGLEVKLVEVIFQKLNLTAEYDISSKGYNSYYHALRETIPKLEAASSDIAIGILPFDSSNTDLAEASIPYIQARVSWYVPCPKPASNLRSIYKIFCTSVWACFCALVTVAVIIMRLLAKYETQRNIRESANYMTITYCIYNVWAVMTGVSVPQKPISLSLRIFFAAWVWYSVAIAIVYQSHFIGLLVNPGFDKSLTTVTDLLQSGIEYGYPGDEDVIKFSDYPYDIIKINRKKCQSIHRCLQRVIEHKDFATISDSFHAEYFKTRLLFHNIHEPVCTLEEDIMIYRVSSFMAKGNPILHRFNKIITYLSEAGLLEKWQHNFMSNLRLSGQPIDGDDVNFSDFSTKQFSSAYLTYSLMHLKVVFYMLIIGQICGSLLFLAEVLYHTACVTGTSSTLT